MKKIDRMSCLQRLADHLQTYATPIRPAWSNEAETAIRAFLNGEAATLDAAFGLAPARGRPTKDDEHKAIARKVFTLRLRGASWLIIAGTIDGGKWDERTIRRIFKQHFAEVATEQITLDEIMQADDAEDDTRP